MSKNKTIGADLKVVIVLNGREQPAWILKALRDLSCMDFLSSGLKVFCPNSKTSQLPAEYDQKGLQYFLYKLYTKIDYMRADDEVDDAFEFGCVDDVIESGSLLLIEKDKNFISTVREEFKNKNIDLILDFSFSGFYKDLADISKYGVWVFHYGNNLSGSRELPGFWEVMNKEDIISSGMKLYSINDKREKKLFKVNSKTEEFSVKKTRNSSYWKIGTVLLSRLKLLHEYGHEALMKLLVNEVSDLPVKDKQYVPSNFVLFPKILAQLAGYIKKNFLELITFSQWSIAISLNKDDCNPLSVQLSKFKHLVPPKDRFWADPFPVIHDSHRYVFYEEYLYSTGKGHLSVAEVDDTGEIINPKVILDKPYHLSFPFVFKWEDEFYMIPESSENRTVDLYKSENFPYEWKIERTLLDDIRAADSTIFQYGDYWWMFVSIAGENYRNNTDELHLYYAKSPIGPWNPHRGNPVKCDARNARQGGKVIQLKDKFYRVAQDCSRGYGSGLIINEILILDHEQYQEQEVSAILPDWKINLTGAHTFNSDGDLTVVDFNLRRIK